MSTPVGGRSRWPSRGDGAFKPGAECPGSLVRRSFQTGVHPGIVVVVTDGPTTGTIPGDAPMAVALRTAVHGGDLDTVRVLITSNPYIARARFVARGGSGTPLHFVTDWPGYFPHGPDIVHLPMDTGADPNATTTGAGDPRRLCTTPRVATTSMLPSHSLTEARISKHPTALSALHWTMSSAMRAGTSHASWPPGAPASSRSGTPPFSACSTPWRRF